MVFGLLNECVDNVSGRLVSFIFFVMFIYVKYLCLYLRIFYLGYNELPCVIL